MWLRFKQNSFIGFATIGVSTVLVNLLTFQIFLYFGSSIYISTFMGNLVSVAVNYAGLTNVFNSKARINSMLKYVLTWFTYYFLTIWLVILFIDLNISALISRIITLFLLTPINYFAQKYLVFK